MVVAVLFIAACGYKGPLYLPKAKSEAQTPAPKPAPPRDENKPEGS